VQCLTACGKSVWFSGTVPPAGSGLGLGAVAHGLRHNQMCQCFF